MLPETIDNHEYFTFNEGYLSIFTGNSADGSL